MKQLKYEAIGLILDQDEIKVYEKALTYILHRLKQHKGSGARTVGTVESVEKLLRELNRNL